jgi:iron complex outermembrane receptor protein
MLPGLVSSMFADTTAVAHAVEIEVKAERVAPRSSAGDVVREKRVLSAAPHRTAADLLFVCPGLYLTQHSGEGKAYQVYYRGFDAEHGQDLEIWAGGAPVNDVSNLHGQGYADLHFLMPEVVKEVRCTPGSYAPQQGDFAVAGSLNLRLGYDEPGLSAKLSAGSFGSRRYFLGYSPKQGSGDTFAAAELYQTDGFGPSRAARRASLVSQAVLGLPGGLAARIQASTYAGRFDSAGVLRLRDVESGAVERFATYDPRQGGDASRSQLVLELRDAASEAGWAFTPYVVQHDMRLRQNFTGFLRDRADGDSVQQLNQATTLGATSRYHQPTPLFSPTDAVELGFFARTDWIRQSQRRLSSIDDSVLLEEVDARVRAVDVGGYLEASLQPLRVLSVRGGLRLDGLSYAVEDRGGNADGQARASQGAHLGLKGTVEYRPLSWLSLLGSYGDGFRSPQARSLAEGERTPFTTVHSYEAGLRVRDRHGTAASLALFRTLLSEDAAFDPGTARVERVPGTRRTGLSVDVTSLPVEWFTSSVSLTYTRAQFRESGQGFAQGDLLPFVPSWVVRSDSAVTPTLGTLWDKSVKGHLGWGLTYLGNRPLPYGEVGHDVFLVDAGAGIKLDRYQLSLDMFNLLDAHWFDGEFAYPSSFGGGGASLIPTRHVTIGAPRSLLLTLAAAI